MIPAILSCVFVAYLYTTLNAEESPQASDKSESSVSAARVHELKARVDRLAEAARKRGAQ